MPIDADVDEGRDKHPAHGRDAGQDCAAERRQFADEHLALDLEADEKEKHGHQTVVDPKVQRLVERKAADLRPELELEDLVVDVRQPGVLHQHGEDGRDQEHDTARRLVMKEGGNGLDRAPDGHGQGTSGDVRERVGRGAKAA